MRIVHLGLGAFHRAHQAWYTSEVDHDAEWGIAAFTGRSPREALDLQPQDGLFTVIERSGSGDTATIVTSIVEAVDGANVARLRQLMEAPTTSIVTVTVTEAGYRLTAAGTPNLDDPAVAADMNWLTEALSAPTLSDPAGTELTTTLGRLLFALEARRRANAGPIAIVPCDNIPGNGDFIASGLGALARRACAGTANWIEAEVSFVSTSVDRITPRTMPHDLATAAELTGWQDDAAVVAEPFRSWVLAGRFPGGRPAWERAGAAFVDDIEPFERRKLWMLNGAHSFLAYDGLLRGHSTVAEAIADVECRELVGQWWDSVTLNLPGQYLELDEYRAALLERFSNTRIEHQLCQISAEAVTKLRVRIAPIVLAERAAGREASVGIRTLGAWAALVMRGYTLVDSESAAVAIALENVRAAGSDRVVERLIALIDSRLAADNTILAGVQAATTFQNTSQKWTIP